MPARRPPAAVVLYIGGSGRSGSTLLDLMLGQVAGFCSTGELVRLWDLGLRDNQLCGCGTPFLSCPFWSQVGGEAFGGWCRLDLERVLYLHHRVRRHRYLPLVLARGAAPRFRREVSEYTGLMVALYDAIVAVSRCPVVVDSSKEPAYGLLLRTALGSDARFVHLVRDSRGVAFSWTKRVAMPDQPDRYLPRYRPAHTALRWVGYNTLFGLVAGRPPRRLLVRYEDFVHDPRANLDQIAGLVADVVQPPVVQPPAGRWTAPCTPCQLDGVHTVAGNPMRLSRGTVRIEQDDAWRKAMPYRQRALVSALSAPGLIRYGYAVVAGSRGSGGGCGRAK
jgi:hypothetical protein